MATSRWLRWRNGIQARFLAMFAVFVVLSMTIVGATLFFSQRQIMLTRFERDTRDLLAALHDKGNAYCAFLARIAPQGMLAHDYLLLEGYVEELSADPDIVYSVILNRAQRPITHFLKDRDRRDATGPRPAVAPARFADALAATRADPALLIVRRDIEYEGMTLGSVEVGLSRDKVGRHLEELKATLGMELRRFATLTSGEILIALVVLILLSEWTFNRLVMRPIHALGADMARVRSGDLGVRARVGRNDEIGWLARNFNDMTVELERQVRRIEAQQHELLQAEKMAYVGQVSAWIAHQIRNSLGRILMSAGVLRPGPRVADAVRDAHRDLTAAITEMDKMVSDLLDYSRTLSLHTTRVDLNAALEDLLASLTTCGLSANHRIERAFDPGLPAVQMDVFKMEQAFGNVLKNAIQAMPRGGTLRLETRRGPDERQVTVVIADSGTGIRREDLPRVFRPFFTTKPGGTGLGLAIASRIVEAHGGRVDVTSKEDKTIKAKVDEVRKPFVAGTFVSGQQVTVGGNITTLLRPVDEIIAHSQVDLHRSNFMDEDMPAVVEGSSHDLIADAMRWAGGSDTAAIRGFRYGTHIPAGTPIRMNDIYHYIPVAAKLGTSPKACGADLKLQVENSSQGVFHPDPTQWAGGWMFGYSGVTFDLDACDGLMTTPITPVGSAGAWKTFRGTNIAVGGQLIDINDAYDATTKTCKSGNPSYKVAGYWYADDPTTINNCPPCRGRLIQVVTNDFQIVDLVAGQPLPDGNTLLDVTEAMVRYLRDGLGGVVTASNLPLHRITVKRLPTINPYPFKVIQPLNGSSAATCPAL